MKNIALAHLPYAPLRITSRFGPRNTGISGASTDHKGVDIGADKSKPYTATDGGPVTAVLPGVVVSNYYNSARGWVILIDHGTIGGYNVKTLYQHLKQAGSAAGTKVEAGDRIGTMGNTGVGAQLHLHFELQINNKPEDPEPYLKGVEDLTKDETIKLIKSLVPELIEESKKIAKKPENVEDYAKPTIDRLIKEGHIAPNKKGEINMSEDLVRAIVILDRRLGQ